jgi:hypothetical protein
VINVAASQEQFELFVQALLGAVGLARDIRHPRLTFFPVHRLIWDRASYPGARRRPKDGETSLGQANSLWKRMPRATR